MFELAHDWIVGNFSFHVPHSYSQLRLSNIKFIVRKRSLVQIHIAYSKNEPPVRKYLLLRTSYGAALDLPHTRRKSSTSLLRHQIMLIAIGSTQRKRVTVRHILPGSRDLSKKRSFRQRISAFWHKTVRLPEEIKIQQPLADGTRKS